MMPDSVMIFAAGLGTRMGALTRDRPKPLIPVAGKPLIDHALDLAKVIAPRRIVVNTHYKAEMLRAHLAGKPVQFSDEPDMILETGGGLRQALPLLGPGPVFTLNSDAVWRGPNPLATLRVAWKEQEMQGLLLLVPRGAAVGHMGPGDFLIGPDGRLTRGAGPVYSGAQILCTADLEQIPDQVFSLNRVWDRMIARGTLFGVVYPGQWCDVGQPDSLPLAEAMLGQPNV
jgi:N-acetyl-alpha-D-muramate 1-phosphate uridylyltransferase